MAFDFRVLHVIPSVALCRGGPSVAAFAMCRALARSGIHCDLLTTNDAGPDLLPVSTRDWIEESGFRVHYLPRFSPSWPQGLREFAFSPALGPWLANHLHQYDMVHVHALFSHVPSRVMWECRQKQIPYVLRPLGILEDYSLGMSRWKKRLFLAARDAQNIRHASAVHWTSTREMQASSEVRKLRLSSTFPQEDWIIPLGVDAPKLAGRQQEEKTPCILFLSRWARKKQIPLLLKALAELRDRDWSLMLAGGTLTEHPDIGRGIRDGGLVDRVSTPGFLADSDRESAFAHADLFVLPSASENFGMAVAEAMIRGVPPVVTPAVALASEIAENRAGWVSGDSVQELAETLREALSDPQERLRRGKAAAVYAQRHLTWSACASALSERYQTLLHQP